jgi:hypothetical protein
MRSDLEVLEEFVDEVGGLSEAARMLTSGSVCPTPQTVFNWMRRGRVAAGQRLHFLTVFNDAMPKEHRLPLEWLAAPKSQRRATNGGASRWQAEGKARGKAQGQRREAARAGA